MPLRTKPAAAGTRRSRPKLLTEMLSDEVAVARERLGDRIAELRVVGTDVMCRLEGTNVGAVILRFAARDYDAEPLRFAVVTSLGEVAERVAWPGNLFHSIHPILERPFSCVQGTYEYHCFPGHTADRWDTHRATLRLPRLLDHLVIKAGL